MVSDKVAPSNGKSKISVIAWSIIGVLVLVIFIIPYALTSNPKACTRCHEMDHYYDSWKESVHSTAVSNCFYCHVKPGAVSLAVYRVSFYREIIASASNSKLKPSGATIPATNNCNRSGCHSLNRISSISGDLRVNHRNHITKAKLTCVKCHPGVSHPNGNVIPPRTMCKKCHSQRMDDCAMCHTKRFQRGAKYKH